MKANSQCYFSACRDNWLDCETVMDSNSLGSVGEVSATRACLCFSGGQERLWKGRAELQGGGMRTWKQ